MASRYRDDDLCVCYLGGGFSRDLALYGREAKIGWATEDLSQILRASVVHWIIIAQAMPFDCDGLLGDRYSY